MFKRVFVIISVIEACDKQTSIVDFSFKIVLAVSYFVYTAKQIPPENTISDVLYEVVTTA